MARAMMVSRFGAGVFLLGSLAAGTVPAQAQDSGLSVWTATSHSNVADNNKDITFNRKQYEGDINTFTLGVGKRQNSRLLTGVALTAAKVSLDTLWNFGTYESDSTSLAPYFTYLLNDTFSLNGSLGYAWNEANMKASLGAVPPNSASYDSGRTFASLGVKASRWFDKFNLTGHLNYSYSTEDIDGYTWDRSGMGLAPLRVKSSRVDYGRTELGVKASYLYGKAMPYVGIAYADGDITRSYVLPPGTRRPDQDGLVYTMGINLFTTNSVSAGIHLRKEDRHKLENNSIAANLTLRF